ncbi:hypothetical protein FSB65_21475 [Paraburkholderia sp. JPY418]|nr:hypothetical protein [Paraburkholderia youngii]
MPCIPIRTPDGAAGFICTRDRRTGRRCSVDGCRAPSGFQCDYPVSPRRTCDRHLCAQHAHEAAPDVHYCPEHFAQFQRDGGRLQAALNFDETTPGEDRNEHD